MSDLQYAVDNLVSFQKDINETCALYFATAEAKQGIRLTRHGEEAFGLLEEFSRRPGKRIRGALAMVAYKMFGGSSTSAPRELALAVELMQNSLLIIDDVMDQSPIRRGGAAVHEYYLAKKSERLDSHLSNMVGIDIGVLAMNMAGEIVSSIRDEEPSRILLASTLFHRSIAITCYGQLEDLVGKITLPSEDDILYAYALKSSYYTFVNPLQAGAALAGASGADIQALHDFGYHAGIVFQLHDDLIGMFGDPKQTGKSNTDDLQEGKMTVLMQHALSHGNKAQVDIIRKILGNEDVVVKEFEAVKKILIAIGSREYVMAKAEFHAAEAERILAAQPAWDESGVKFLRGMLAYIVSRDN